MGYHKTEIPKGKLGKFSKIEEEWAELLDARAQNQPVLMLCEICDLLGAIQLYLEQRYSGAITIEQCLDMARKTMEHKEGR
jgi:phosphoribosyl-ATP pyrophosphohydrolase